MTRTPYDQYAKQYLEGLLKPLGEPKISREVTAEVRQVDIWFVPNEVTTTDREILGLLGRMVATPCLLEPFRNPAGVNDIRACLGKLLQVQTEAMRNAKRQKKKLTEAELPHLWILVPSSSRRLLQQFGAEQHDNWATGIYFLPESLRTALVAIANLPATADTLWLRLLGRGSVQQQAIAELLLIKHPFRRHALGTTCYLASYLASETESKSGGKGVGHEFIARLRAMESRNPGSRGTTCDRRVFSGTVRSTG
jgi:hypothetical protein